jgi:peptidyl-prolyl cis-trans isomerase C
VRRGARVLVWLVALALVAGASGAAAKEKKDSKGKPAAAAVDPAEVLAWVAGQPITKTDLENRLSELSPQYRQQFSTAEGKKQLLDRMVEENVWTLAAEKAGVAERPEIKRQVEQSRMNLVVRAYLTEVMQTAPAPSDSVIAAYYEAHQTEPQFMMPPARQVRHIQVGTEKEAKDALAQLKKGADFAGLAKKASLDAATKDNGGDLGRVERLGPFGELGRQPALAETAFAAALRVPVGPVQSTVGWHVLEVRDTIPPAPQPLENVRPRLVQMLSRQSQEDYYREQLEKQKAEAGFRWNQAAVDSFLHGRKTAAELFREAQDAPDADGRIAGYEQVVALYPQSEQAPQAQFMVGFIYSEEKKDYDKAEAAFRKLLSDYPKSELKNSAQWMLDNMRSDAVPSFELPGGVKRTPTTPLPGGVEKR